MQGLCRYRQIFPIMLSALVLCVVNLREVHFLFTEHHAAHENCTNHLHEAEHHLHCELCHAPFTAFTDEVKVFSCSNPEFSVSLAHALPQTFVPTCRVTLPALRGPPALG